MKQLIFKSFVTYWLTDTHTQTQTLGVLSSIYRRSSGLKWKNKFLSNSQKINTRQPQVSSCFTLLNKAWTRRIFDLVILCHHQRRSDHKNAQICHAAWEPNLESNHHQYKHWLCYLYLDLLLQWLDLQTECYRLAY